MPKANFKVGKGVLPEREKEGRKKGKSKDTFEIQRRDKEEQGKYKGGTWEGQRMKDDGAMGIGLAEIQRRDNGGTRRKKRGTRRDKKGQRRDKEGSKKGQRRDKEGTKDG